jgi:hypothetical protein
MYSVTPNDIVNFTQPKGFPSYENGGSFFHSTGLEIAALAISGKPDQAFEVFERVMMKGYGSSNFWGALLLWNTGKLSSEPLNNSLLILWGFLRGCWGVYPHLDRIRVVGNPSKQLEGASYEFAYLGKNKLVQIKNNRVHLKNVY